MKILIVDDHPLYREGLKALMHGLNPEVDIREAASIPQALDVLSEDPAMDLILLDMNLPGISRLDALQAVKSAADQAAVAVISGEEDPHLIASALECGASGYITKTTDPEVTINALRIVMAHGTYLPPVALKALRAEPEGDSAPALTPEALTDRQRAVLRRLVQGKANKVIARELDIAEGTVKAHLAATYQLLGVNSRVQVMCRVHELGWLESLA